MRSDSDYAAFAGGDCRPHRHHRRRPRQLRRWGPALLLLASLALVVLVLLLSGASPSSSPPSSPSLAASAAAARAPAERLQRLQSLSPRSAAAPGRHPSANCRVATPSSSSSSSASASSRLPLFSASRGRGARMSVLRPHSVALKEIKTAANVKLSSPADWTENSFVPTDVQALGDIWDALKDEIPDNICFTDDYHGPKAEMTYKQCWETMNSIGASYQALGLQKGDKVALFSDNSHRWMLADNALLRCGAASAVRGSTAPVDELAYIMQNSDSTALICENPAVLQKLLEKVPSYIAGLKFVAILFPGDEDLSKYMNPNGPRIVTYDELVTRGKEFPFNKPEVGLDDLASLIYTSGTTGKPKGVMLTHRQFVHQMIYQTIQTKASGVFGTLKRLLHNNNPEPGDVFVSILPSWHIFERVAEYWILSRGAHIVYSTIKEFRNDIQRWRPQYLVAVPRLYETIYQGAEKKFNAKPTTAKLVKFFKKVGSRFLNAKRNLQGFAGPTGPISKLGSLISLIFNAPLYFLSDILIWSKIRNGLGGRIKIAISGGSALPMYVEDFFELAKVPVIVGYGLTETTAPIANRLYELNQRGTTGTPTTEVRIVHPETGAILPSGEQGVIQARGDMIMSGYYKDPEATSKVMSTDGFFNTGDLGFINEKGILKITGRQKDTIVLLNGENIEPQPIEEALVASPYIDQVMLVGQDSNFLSAMIVPSLDGLHEAGVIDQSDVKEINDLKANGDEEGLLALGAELSARKALESLVMKEINSCNRGRDGYRPDDNVRKFALILNPFTMENGLLTQTLKVKRNEVAGKYKQAIQELYQR